VKNGLSRNAFPVRIIFDLWLGGVLLRGLDLRLEIAGSISAIQWRIQDVFSKSPFSA